MHTKHFFILKNQTLTYFTKHLLYIKLYSIHKGILNLHPLCRFLHLTIKFCDMHFMTIAGLQCDHTTEMAIHHIFNQIHFFIASTQAITWNVITQSIIIPYRYRYLSCLITESYGSSSTVSNTTLLAQPTTFCVIINYDSYDVYI